MFYDLRWKLFYYYCRAKPGSIPEMGFFAIWKVLKRLDDRFPKRG